MSDEVLRFVQSAESLRSRDAVLSGYLAALAPLGVEFLIYVTTTQDKTDRYVWSNIGIHAHPDADDFFDPFLEYCCSTYASTYTGVEFLDDYPYLSDAERGFIRSAGEMGFKSGLALPVRLENGGRYGGFNLGTGLFKAAFLDRIVPLEGQLAHASVLLNRTLDSLPMEGADNPIPRSDVMLADTLSKRDTDILFLLSQGHSRKDIARMTDLTLNTVNSYIKGVYNKLGVSNRSEATRIAMQIGLKAPRL